MRLGGFLVAASALLGQLPAYAQSPEFESPAAYELVAPLAISLLPEPLTAFLKPNEHQVTSSAVRAMADSGDTEGGPHLAPACPPHSGGNEASHRAALDRVFAVENAQGSAGTLGRRLAAAYEDLVDAFRAESPPRIASAAGVVIHFATDAALPFHRSRESVNVEAARERDADANALWNSERAARHRFHVLLLTRSQDQFAAELRVAPSRVDDQCEPRDAIFRTITDGAWTRAMLETLLTRLDQQRSPQDRRVSGSDAETLRDELTRHAGALMKGRLEAGAILSAQLIHAAWAGAGRPDPAKWTAAPTSSRPAREAGPAASGVVSSKNSQTFHRADCPHADRIKAENVLRYATASEARRAGRQPCKACRPDQ